MKPIRSRNLPRHARQALAIAWVSLTGCVPPAPSPTPPLPRTDGCPTSTLLRSFHEDARPLPAWDRMGLPGELEGAGRWLVSRRIDAEVVALYVAVDLGGVRMTLLRFDATRQQIGPSVTVVHYPNPGSWTIWGADVAPWDGGFAVSWILFPLARHGTTRRSQGFVAFLDDAGRPLGAMKLGPVHSAPVLTRTTAGIDVLHDDERRPTRRVLMHLTCGRPQEPRHPASP